MAMKVTGDPTQKYFSKRSSARQTATTGNKNLMKEKCYQKLVDLVHPIFQKTSRTPKTLPPTPPANMGF